MSITDELREWFKDRIFMANGWQEIRDIADRIDAVHEKAMSRAGQLLADVEKDRDYNYANWQDCKQKVLQHNITIDELDAKIERLEDELSHCIELPKDADGEYIHFGDVLDQFGTPMTVFAMSDPDPDQGDCMLELITDGISDDTWVRARKMRHHREPTVEDVLREFVDALDIDRCEDFNATIAEYAAKLQLRGDAE